MTNPHDDTVLSARLRELAQADERVDVPVRVEQAVLAEWDRTPRIQGRVVSLRTWRWVVVAGSVAALLIVGVMITKKGPISATRVRQPAAEISRSVGTQPQKQTAPDTRAALSETGLQPTRQRSRGPAPSRRPPPDVDRSEPDDTVAVFVPIGPMTAPERDEAMQVVRVRLSRSALLGFGVPIDESHAAEALQADVLLGEDGLARGIRLVKN